MMINSLLLSLIASALPQMFGSGADSQVPQREDQAKWTNDVILQHARNIASEKEDPARQQQLKSRKRQVERNHLLGSQLAASLPEEQSRVAQRELDHQRRLDNSRLEHESFIDIANSALEKSRSSASHDAAKDDILDGFHSNLIHAAHTRRFEEEKQSTSMMNSVPQTPFTNSIASPPLSM